MSPVHLSFLSLHLIAAGYKIEVLPNDNKQAVDMGLKYVNNDACYPSLIVVGQIMDALLSGKYDLNQTAVIISQTGGGCRASNYIGFIRRALKKPAGTHPSHLHQLKRTGGESWFQAISGTGSAWIVCCCIWRYFHEMRLPDASIRGRSRHDRPGSPEMDRGREEIRIGRLSFPPEIQKLCNEIIQDFDTIETLDIKKPRVGIVGEILVKFLPAANNHLAELLESEGAEAVVPDLLDFLLYCFYNQNFKVSHLGMKKSKTTVGNLGIKALEWFRSPASKAFEQSKHFDPPAHIEDLGKMASEIVSLGNQTG